MDRHAERVAPATDAGDPGFRSAHIERDLVGHGFIVNGLVPPQGPPVEAADAQLPLRRRNVCLLADSFAAAGFVPDASTLSVDETVDRIEHALATATVAPSSVRLAA